MSQRRSAGIYCGLNMKQEPRAVYSGFAGTHLTNSYWQQSGWGQAGLLTVVTDCLSVCVCVWWNCTLRDNTLLVLITGPFTGKIASLLSDKGIMCSAMFRLVLFSGGFFPIVCSLSVTVSTDLKVGVHVPISVVSYMSLGCLYHCLCNIWCRWAAVQAV